MKTRAQTTKSLLNWTIAIQKTPDAPKYRYIATAPVTTIGEAAHRASRLALSFFTCGSVS